MKHLIYARNRKLLEKHHQLFGMSNRHIEIESFGFISHRTVTVQLVDIGVQKTLSKVRHIYFWYAVRKFAVYWCQKCDASSRRKSPYVMPKAPIRQYN